MAKWMVKDDSTCQFLKPDLRVALNSCPPAKACLCRTSKTWVSQGLSAKHVSIQWCPVQLEGTSDGQSSTTFEVLNLLECPLVNLRFSTWSFHKMTPDLFKLHVWLTDPPSSEPHDVPGGAGEKPAKKACQGASVWKIVMKILRHLARNKLPDGPSSGTSTAGGRKWSHGSPSHWPSGES